MGNVFLNSTSFMALYGAIFSLIKVNIFVLEIFFSSFNTINAFGIWPRIGTGFPITAQSFTAGCS